MGALQNSILLKIVTFRVTELGLMWLIMVFCGWLWHQDGTKNRTTREAVRFSLGVPVQRSS